MKGLTVACVSGNSAIVSRLVQVTRPKETSFLLCPLEVWGKLLSGLVCNTKSLQQAKRAQRYFVSYWWFLQEAGQFSVWASQYCSSSFSSSWCFWRKKRRWRTITWTVHNLYLVWQNIFQHYSHLFFHSIYLVANTSIFTINCPHYCSLFSFLSLKTSRRRKGRTAVLRCSYRELPSFL